MSEVNKALFVYSTDGAQEGDIYRVYRESGMVEWGQVDHRGILCRYVTPHHGGECDGIGCFVASCTQANVFDDIIFYEYVTNTSEIS